jgi:SAM-dependent methyltransferase
VVDRRFQLTIKIGIDKRWRTLAKEDQYFLGHGEAEQGRLQRQAEEFAQSANELCDEIGIVPGWRVVELGCGPRGCLDLLSQRVGANGSVVGVEINSNAVELARRYLVEARIGNAEVRQGDGRATGLPRGSFDLATERFVMVNIPEPERIVAEMVGLVRPGGVVAIHEVDWGLRISEPPLAALDRLAGAFETYAHRNGMDFFVGRKVQRWLRAAGLLEVRVRPIAPACSPDNAHRTVLLQFAENLRDRILGEDLISETEFNECVASLKLHLADPATFLQFPLMIQAWGRKPVQ